MEENGETEKRITGRVTAWVFSIYIKTIHIMHFSSAHSLCWLGERGTIPGKRERERQSEENANYGCKQVILRIHIMPPVTSYATNIVVTIFRHASS